VDFTLFWWEAHSPSPYSPNSQLRLVIEQPPINFTAVRMSEEEGRMHSLCLQLPSVSQSFFGGEKCPKRRASFLKREYSVANAHLKKIKIRQTATENLFCCRGCPQIHAYWLNVYDFCGKDSPVKLKCLSLWLHEGIWKRKHCCESAMVGRVA